MRRNLTIIVVLTAAVIGAGGIVFSGHIVGWFLARSPWNGRIRLLRETDHEALLAACRELSKEVASGKLKPGVYDVRPIRDRIASRFPKAILHLRPHSVTIGKDGLVMLGIAGAFDDYGVYAWPEDYDPNLAPINRSGGRELLKGLWYYDEFYRGKGREEWDEQVQAMLRENKTRKRSQAT